VAQTVRSEKTRTNRMFSSCQQEPMRSKEKQLMHGVIIGCSGNVQCIVTGVEG
jgi:hypothetical protein